MGQESMFDTSPEKDPDYLAFQRDSDSGELTRLGLDGQYVVYANAELLRDREGNIMTSNDVHELALEVDKMRETDRNLRKCLYQQVGDETVHQLPVSFGLLPRD